MYISKIELKNFKKFENVSFELNSNLNILTGENSCGKSSVLDALSIWYECFIKSIYKLEHDNELRRRNNGRLRKGDWSFTDSKIPKFKHYKTASFKDIKCVNCRDRNVEIYLTIIYEEQDIKIGFGIKDTLNNVLPLIDESNLITFNSIFRFADKSDIVNRFYISLIMPMMNIVQPKEIEISNNYFKNEILRGNSVNWIKNRIYKISKEPNKLGDIDAALKNIFNNPSIQLKINYDLYNIDEHIKISVSGIDSNEFDLSLMGSGFLQTLNIILDLYSNSTGFKVYLLDEPDSHLHRNIQHKFLSFLQDISNKDNVQIIMTTHSIPIIRKANIDEIFHIDNTESTYKPVANNELVLTDRVGFQGSKKVNIYNSLGVNSTSNLIDAIEANKIVFVEGIDDAHFIKSIGKYNPLKFNIDNVYFWTLKGASDVLLKLKYYKEILSQISNGESLWSKSLLVLDRDSLVDDEITALLTAIEGELDIKVYFWDTYAIENQFFKDLQLLRAALTNINPDINSEELINDSLALQYDFAELENLASDEFQKLEKAFSGQRRNKATEYKKLDFNNKKFISFIEEDQNKKASQFLKKSCQNKDIIKYIKLKKCFANICRKLELDEMILIDKLVKELPPDMFKDIADFVYN